MEAAPARQAQRPGGRRALRVVATDPDLARLVGLILRAARAGSSDLVGAHSVAIAARYAGGTVVSADPGDMERLAAALPAEAIVTPSPLRPVSGAESVGLSGW